jgi:arginase family enzyme
LAQAREALGIFAGSPKAVGLVVAEFNADHDADGTLARALVDTIEGAMAKRV